MAFERKARSFNDADVSTATERVRPRRPALDAAYGTAPVPLFSARREETLIIHFEAGFLGSVRSLRLLRIRLRMEARRNAREVRIAPSRFVRRILVISESSILGRMLEVDIPAALTRMSMLPCESLVG
jgi:hypothetical protein